MVNRMIKILILLIILILSVSLYNIQNEQKIKTNDFARPC